MINDKFLARFRGCSYTGMGVLKKRVDRSAPNLVATLSDHRYTPRSKMVKISCSVSKPQRLKLERYWALRPKSHILRRGGEMSLYFEIVSHMTEPPVYMSAAAPSAQAKAWQKRTAALIKAFRHIDVGRSNGGYNLMIFEGRRPHQSCAHSANIV